MCGKGEVRSLSKPHSNFWKSNKSQHDKKTFSVNFFMCPHRIRRNSLCYGNIITIRFPNLNFLRLSIARPRARPTRCLFTSLKLILFINRYTGDSSAREPIHQFHSICPHTLHLLRSKAINDAQQAGVVFQNKLIAFPSASS